MDLPSSACRIGGKEAGEVLSGQNDPNGCDRHSLPKGRPQSGCHNLLGTERRPNSFDYQAGFSDASKGSQEDLAPLRCESEPKEEPGLGAPGGVHRLEQVFGHLPKRDDSEFRVRRAHRYSRRLEMRLPSNAPPALGPSHGWQGLNAGIHAIADRLYLPGTDGLANGEFKGS